MAKRRYAVLRAEEWRKRYDDTTLNLLTTDGFHSSDGISTPHGDFIQVNTPDDEVFQKNKYYLMTLEELPMIEQSSPGNPRPYEAFIEERRKRDNGDVIMPGPGARLFRGIK